MFITILKEFIEGVLKLLGQRFNSIEQVDTHHGRGDLISKKLDRIDISIRQFLALVFVIDSQQTNSLIADDDRAEDKIARAQLRHCITGRLQMIFIRHLGNVINQHDLAISD